jgi:hypothetical protein
MTQAKIGDHVLVAVDPNTNNGVAEAPAVVTRVLPDDDGTQHVSLTVFPHLGIPYVSNEVRLFDDQTAAEEWLASQLGDLVGHGPEGKDGRAWEPIDVARWCPAAYVAGDAAAPVEEPAPPAEPTRDELLAQIQQLQRRIDATPAE